MESCCRIVDLSCKEVVNICDGSRLGYVDDVEIDTCTGRIVALVVPSGSGVMSLLGKGEDLVVPWECIEKIGDDIILVKHQPVAQSTRPHRGKSCLFRK